MELSKDTTLRVSAVAIRQGKDVYSLPPPYRHGDLRVYMVLDLGRPKPHLADEGFLLSDGSFATRSRATKVGLAAGQCAMPLVYGGGELHSEDLWCDVKSTSINE